MIYRQQQFIKRETIGDEISAIRRRRRVDLVLGFGVFIWVFAAGDVCTIPSPSDQDLNR
jgi:hypothetical protein